MAPARSGIREQYGLRPIINVCGTMTALGASIVVPEAVSAVAALLPEFVEIDDLQRKASAAIARLCQAEAGFVTASCSAAITLGVAAAMTGADLAAIERLPDVSGLKDAAKVWPMRRSILPSSTMRLTGASGRMSSNVCRWDRFPVWAVVSRTSSLMSHGFGTMGIPSPASIRLTLRISSTIRESAHPLLLI